MSEEVSLSQNGCWICSSVSHILRVERDVNPAHPIIGDTDPPEYPWLYAIPAVVFTGGFLAAASTGMAGLVQAGYLTSSVLCISKMT